MTNQTLAPKLPLRFERTFISGLISLFVFLFAALFVSPATASATTVYSISGTVGYSGAHTGRIYVALFDQNGNLTGYGTSIAAPGSFTINGVLSGTYTLGAIMDVLGNGTMNAADPLGGFQLTVTGNMTGQAITIVDQPVPTPVTPLIQGVMTSGGTAVIQWQKPESNVPVNNLEIADHYQINWGTDTAASNGGIINVPANGQNMYIQTGLANGSSYYYSIQAIVNGTASAPSAVSGPYTVNAGSGPYTVSGIVNVPIAPTGPLYVGLYNGSIYMGIINSPAQGSNAYTIPGVPDGNYTAFAVLDQNTSGQFIPGNLMMGVNDGPQYPVVVNGANMSQNLNLAIANATAIVSTTHQYDGVNNNYSLNLEVQAQQKLPVSVTLINGPNVAYPVDYSQNGNNNTGSFSQWPYIGSVRPNVGDTYTFAVTYSDGTSEDISGQVSAVLDSFPTSLGVANTPSANVPTFNWAAPTTPPPYYTYVLGVWQQNGGQVWDYPSHGNNMPSTQTSVQFNTDSTANPTSLVNGTTYNWNVSVVDANNNQAQYQAYYTPGGAATYGVSGQVSGAISSGVIMTLSGAASASATTDINGNYSFTGLVNGSSYTVTPSLAGYTFNPSNSSFTVNGADQTGVNFTSSVSSSQTYSVSGQVSGAVSNGVTMTLSGAASASATTDINGNYSFTGLVNGSSYTVTPSLAGYTFNPADSLFTINGLNVTENFIANTVSGSNYTISGNVWNDNGGVAQGVSLALIQNATTIATATTDSNGNYAFSNVPDGIYTVTPSISGGNAIFTPLNQTVTVNGNNVSGVSFGVNAAFSVSGTVSYSGSQTGWIYVGLYDQSGNSTGHGISIQTPGSFTIRGVPPGTYLLAAGMDVLGYGVPNAIDPQYMPVNATIVNGDVTGQTLTLADQASPAPVAPTLKKVNPTDQTAFINWKPAYNANNLEIDDHYHIYWGTDSAALNGGIINVPADGQHMFIQSGLTNGTQYYYKMTGLVNGVESAATAVYGPVTVGPASGLYTVSGIVNVPAGTTGPLYVGIRDDYSGTLYATEISLPVTGANSYNVPGISNGTYGAFAFIDKNNNGQPDTGDLTTGMNGDYIPVVVNGSGMTQNLSLAFENGTSSVTTTHWTDGVNNSYSLNLEIDGMQKLPVNVALVNGPNVPYPVDISPSASDNPGTFRDWTGTGATSPNVGDTYTFNVTYADGSTETFSSSVGAVLDSFAQNLGVINSPSMNMPTFNWSGPASPPAFYSYSINVGQQNGGQVWNYPKKGNMPSNKTSVQFDTDNNASPSSLVNGTTYDWQVSVHDASGNQAQYTAYYTPSGASVSGNVSGAVLNGVTITLSGAASGSTVTDVNGNYLFAGLSNGSYTATPSLSGYTFSPASQSITINGQDLTGVNFTSISNSVSQTYSISGQVSGAVSNGVTITLSGTSNATATTDINGNYSFTGLVNAGSYTVTPSDNGYSFSPSSQSVIINGTNQTANFTSTSNPTYTVTYNGNGATGGNVPVDSNSYTQGQTVTVMGNIGGLVETNYTFAGWNTMADGSGTTYAPGQTFTMGSANTTLYALWAYGDYGYVYVTNSNGNSVSQYTLGVNGVLAPMSNASVQTGNQPAGITVDPSGKYAYVTNSNSQTVARYMMGVNGALTSPITAATGTTPMSVTVDPSDKYAYVADEIDNSVSQYTIGADGSLTAMSPATVAAGTNPVSITVDPSDKFAYVVNLNSISQYTIGAGGALVPMSPAAITTGNSISRIVVDPSGKYAYVTNNYNGTVLQYTIGVGGALAAMSPATVPAGNAPEGIAVDPSGKYVYVTNDGDKTVSQYTIGTGGALAAMSPATVAAGTNPDAVTVDPSGRYAYVTNAGDNSVSQYALGAGGALSFIANTPTGAAPADVVTAGLHPYAMTGNISSQGSPLTGVNVALSGGASGDVITDANGNYFFGGLVNGGSYTVMPSLAGYTFNPSSTSVTVNGASPIVNFAAVTYGISGTVSGAVVNGVTVTLSGASNGSAITDNTGNYSFTGLANGSYTVTPSYSGYSFTPASQSVIINGASVSGDNFTSSVSGHAIYGNVSANNGGAAAPGVTMALIQNAVTIATAGTDGSGNFAFANVPDGTYTITPSLSGGSATFSPSSQAAMVNGSDVNNVNFQMNGGYDISGTVTYGGAHTGRIYVGLFDQNKNAVGLGASIASPGAFTIRGVPPGSYILGAAMDILGYGTMNAADPLGGMAIIVNGTMTGQNITITDQSLPTPVTPTLKNVMTSGGTAVIQWKRPKSNTPVNGLEIADHYRINWGTDAAASNGGIINVPANGQNMYIQTGLVNGSSYYYSIQAIVNGTASAPSSVAGPYTVNAGSGPYTVSGIVNVPEAPTGPLYVGIYNGSNIYTDIVNSPAQGSNAYTIPGVPDGEYSAFAVLDQNNSGQFNAGNLMLGVNGNSYIPVVVNGAGVSQNIDLAIANATAMVSTIHSMSASGDNYSLDMNLEPQQKMPVNVALVNGPNVPYPVDMSPSGMDKSGIDEWVNIGSIRPNVGDTYTFTVSYADGSSENISSSVTAVLDSFAQNLGVTNAPSAFVPTFSWAAPASPPSHYNYNISVQQNNGGQVWYYPNQGNGMPSAQTSVQFNADGSANPASLVSGTTYNWQVGVQDQDGNQAQYQSAYTPTGTQLYSISGYESGAVSNGVTMTLSGSANATTTTDASGYYSFTGLVNGGSYTVTPSLAGYTFNPPNMPVYITGADVTGVNFTATGACTMPYYISVPSTSDSYGDIYVSWNDDASGYTYYLDRSTDGVNWTNIWSGTGTSFTDTSLPGGTYYYRVKATKAGYSESAYVTSSACTVTARPCTTPYYISVPSTSDSYGNAYISWNDDSSGYTYYLDRSTDGVNWTTIWTGTSLSYTDIGLSSGTYYYRVKATKAGYVDSAYQTSGALTVTVCTKPYFISVPSSGDSYGNVYISWNDDASGYTYYLDRSTDGVNWTTIWTGTSLSYTDTGLSSGTYYYRVKATKAGYVDSAYQTSGACSITRSCTEPYFISVPSSGDSWGNVYISWNDDASGYTYYLDRSTDGVNWTNIWSGTSLNFTDAGLASGTYYYRVKATKSGNSDSAYQTSSACVITRPSITPYYISVPSSGDSWGNVYISWNDDSSGYTYYLDRSMDGVNWTNIWSGTSLNFTDAGLASGTYYYRVKATKSGNSDSAYQISGACVITRPCTMPYFISVPSSSDNYGNVYISWNDDANGYTYYLDRSADGVNWTNIWSGSSLSYTDTGLASGTYYYRVKATKAGSYDSPYQTSGACVVNHLQ